jgi:hypothetical protein
VRRLSLKHFTVIAPLVDPDMVARPVALGEQTRGPVG